MRSVFKRTACLVCLFLSCSLLWGCSGKKQQPTVPTEAEIITLPTAPPATESPTIPKEKEDVETLAVVMQPGELYTLDQYPNLKSVDLTGSTCYGAILDFMDNHPDLDVTFTVPLGNIDVSVKETSIALSPGSFDYDTLLENLQYLPNLTTISLPGVSLSAEQIQNILSAYPNIVLDYSVDILGTTYTLDTTQLDLSGMDASAIGEVSQKLGLLTNLTDVTLGSNLSFDNVDQLQFAVPHVVFHYSFSLFGKTISTGDEEVIYKKQDIGNDGEAQLRDALRIMDHCKRFVLDDCGFDYEVLAKVREDFRGGPKVVWRVYFGTNNRYTTLTDDDTIDAVYNVTDSTSGAMKYLEDVKYMDIGHNEYLTDLSFVAYMPELEVLIASESGVKELVGFENCKKLTWLELAYCYKLENIDSLAGCEGLKYLNLSYSKVTSFEPLDALPLERFVYLKPKASTAEQNTFTAIHPKGECITVFYGYSMPYSYGWRYDDNGKTYFWYYKDVIRKVFNYDQKQAILDAQAKAAGK